MGFTNSSLFFNHLRTWKISILLLPFAIYFIFTRGTYTLIDSADLIIHEAGHFVFMLFGNFIYMAGGTLMQIIFPLFLAWYFLRNNYITGVQIFIFWLAQNLVNISVYAADAPIRKLRLLGGGKHDWYAMLTQLGLLDYADIIGVIFFLLAILTFIFSLLIPLLSSSLSYGIKLSSEEAL